METTFISVLKKYISEAPANELLEIKDLIDFALSDTSIINKVNIHKMRCFCCGGVLQEIGLGHLKCGICDGMFIPYFDVDGNQCLSNIKPVRKCFIGGDM